MEKEVFKGKLLMGLALFAGWMIIDSLVFNPYIRIAGDSMLLFSLILLFSGKKNLSVIFDEK